MSGPRLLVVTVAIVALLVPGLAGRSVMAAEEPEATVLELTAMPAQDARGKPLEGQYWIAAVLTTEDGRYVADRPLQITEPVDFFGPREAKLGTAVTDGTGFTAVMYQPSQAGEHTIVARFRGDNLYAASKAELVVDLPGVVAPFIAEPVPLTSVGQGLALFLGVLGVVFWAVLFGVVGRTVWGIKHAPGAAADPGPVVESRRQEVTI